MTKKVLASVIKKITGVVPRYSGRDRAFFYTSDDEENKISLKNAPKIIVDVFKTIEEEWHTLSQEHTSLMEKEKEIIDTGKENLIDSHRVLKTHTRMEMDKLSKLGIFFSQVFGEEAYKLLVSYTLLCKQEKESCAKLLVEEQLQEDRNKFEMEFRRFNFEKTTKYNALLALM